MNSAIPGRTESEAEVPVMGPEDGGEAERTWGRRRGEGRSPPAALFLPPDAGGTGDTEISLPTSRSAGHAGEGAWDTGVRRGPGTGYRSQKGTGYGIQESTGD